MTESVPYLEWLSSSPPETSDDNNCNFIKNTILSCDAVIIRRSALGRIGLYFMLPATKLKSYQKFYDPFGHFTNNLYYYLIKLILNSGRSKECIDFAMV